MTVCICTIHACTFLYVRELEIREVSFEFVVASRLLELSIRLGGVKLQQRVLTIIAIMYHSAAGIYGNNGASSRAQPKDKLN